jgi:hypothetical protein
MKKKLSDHLSFIEKYKAPKEYKTLEELILNPTLDKAQKSSK